MLRILNTGCSLSRPSISIRWIKEWLTITGCCHVRETWVVHFTTHHHLCLGRDEWVSGDESWARPIVGVSWKHSRPGRFFLGESFGSIISKLQYQGSDKLEEHLCFQLLRPTTGPSDWEAVGRLASSSSSSSRQEEPHLLWVIISNERVPVLF